jgi:uncharacterized protein YndB with AHSA1/START domain
MRFASLRFLAAPVALVAAALAGAAEPQGATEQQAAQPRASTTAASAASAASAAPLVNEAIINAPVDEVWRLFTTAEGMQSWMVPRAEIDLRVGGLMRTRYGEDGALGDDKTIVNRILSFEPQRMLSLQVDKAPADFEFRDHVAGMWTVIYFQPLEPGMTSVRVVGLGFRDDASSARMREYFKRGNAFTLEQLQKKFWAKCASCAQ